MTRKELLDSDWARLEALCGRKGRTRGFSSNFSPRFAHIVLIRTAQTLHSRGWRLAAKFFSLLNFLLFGIEVPAGLEIGPGLIIPHTQGTILGAARIGRDVTIYQQVTLGAKLADYDYDPATRPVVEDAVTITAGAKILGALTLGTGCTVGANAVVLDDVPPGVVAVGVPARILNGRT